MCLYWYENGGVQTAVLIVMAMLVEMTVLMTVVMMGGIQVGWGGGWGSLAGFWRHLVACKANPGGLPAPFSYPASSES